MAKTKQKQKININTFVIIYFFIIIFVSTIFFSYQIYSAAVAIIGSQTIITSQQSDTEWTKGATYAITWDKSKLTELTVIASLVNGTQKYSLLLNDPNFPWPMPEANDGQYNFSFETNSSIPPGVYRVEICGQDGSNNEIAGTCYQSLGQVTIKGSYSSILNNNLKTPPIENSLPANTVYKWQSIVFSWRATAPNATDALACKISWNIGGLTDFITVTASSSRSFGPITSDTDYTFSCTVNGAAGIINPVTLNVSTFKNTPVSLDAYAEGAGFINAAAYTVGQHSVFDSVCGTDQPINRAIWHASINKGSAISLTWPANKLTGTKADVYFVNAQALSVLPAGGKLIYNASYYNKLATVDNSGVAIINVDQNIADGSYFLAVCNNGSTDYCMWQFLYPTCSGILARYDFKYSGTSVKVTSQISAEDWVSGGQANVTWSSSGLSSTAQTKIILWNPKTLTGYKVVGNLPNNGSATFTIPDLTGKLTYGSYYVKVCINNLIGYWDCDYSDSSAISLGDPNISISNIQMDKSNIQIDPMTWAQNPQRLNVTWNRSGLEPQQRIIVNLLNSSSSIDMHLVDFNETNPQTGMTVYAAANPVAYEATIPNKLSLGIPFSPPSLSEMTKKYRLQICLGNFNGMDPSYKRCFTGPELKVNRQLSTAYPIASFTAKNASVTKGDFNVLNWALNPGNDGYNCSLQITQGGKSKTISLGDIYGGVAGASGAIGIGPIYSPFNPILKCGADSRSITINTSEPPVSNVVACANSTPSPAPSPSVTVLSPTTAQIWRKGGVYNVRWSTDSSIPVYEKMRIVLWNSATQEGWRLADVPNNGNEDVVIPDTWGNIIGQKLIPAGCYHVKVCNGNSTKCAYSSQRINLIDVNANKYIKLPITRQDDGSLILGTPIAQTLGSDNIFKENPDSYYNLSLLNYRKFFDDNLYNVSLWDANNKKITSYKLSFNGVNSLVSYGPGCFTEVMVDGESQWLFDDTICGNNDQTPASNIEFPCYRNALKIMISNGKNDYTVNLTNGLCQ